MATDFSAVSWLEQGARDRHELNALNLLQTPVWVFDLDRMQMWWANHAALQLWQADSLEELLARDWSDASAATRTRLQWYRERFQRGETVTERWTFYPKRRAISVRCTFRGLTIEAGRLAMLCEGTMDGLKQMDADTLRSVEALRHTTVMISLYYPDGRPIAQNPAALRAYGDERLLAGENALARRFVDPWLFDRIVEAVSAGKVYSLEAEMRTLAGIRWHGMDVRQTNDPATGGIALLINEHDITDRRLVESDLQNRDRLLQGFARATNYLLVTQLGDLDTAIAQALAIVGESARVDRVGLLENYPHTATEKRSMRLRAEWTAEGIPSLRDESLLQNFSYTLGAGDWGDRLSRGEPIYGMVDAFSDPERTYLEQLGVCSIAIAPIVVHQELWGLLCFDCCRFPRRWLDGEVSLLKLGADSIGGSILRQHASRTLEQINTELESRVVERTAALMAANEQLRLEIAVKEQLAEQLRYNAFHDSLTGLPNRALFLERLAAAFQEYARDRRRTFCVLFLDVDRFKTINDSHGHGIGDRLLLEIAARLRACTPARALVARLGGDEFAILLQEDCNLEIAKSVANAIQTTLTQSYHIQQRDIFTSVSIGIACSSPAYAQPEDILRAADIVMYQAKEAGRSRYEVFDATTHHRVIALHHLEHDLHRAANGLAEDSDCWYRAPQFFVYYQPIVSLQNGEICGFEALMRWHHPERGIISPDAFIPLAEETGAIVPLGHWVLHEVCQQMGRWQQQFCQQQALFVSVNVSARQFSHPDPIGTIDALLHRYGLEGRHLKIELTERSLMTDEANVARILQQFKIRNVQIGIDDFGTGYSSLSYLHQLPIDVLKIDRSFISQYETATHSGMEIVRTILSLSQALALETVAEGIETTAQAIALQQMGCQFGQGYLFSPPVDAATATQLLRRRTLMVPDVPPRDRQS